MLPIHKQKALAAIKRLEGLMKKLHSLIEEDSYCPEILRIALSMQGHIKHIQGHVLESHLHTCAPKKLASKKDHNAFVAELLRVIGLSQR
jgi:CsoR family transcriptional regulator, copper-sensing transcriptional repressor